MNETEILFEIFKHTPKGAIITASGYDFDLGFLEELDIVVSKQMLDCQTSYAFRFDPEKIEIYLKFYCFNHLTIVNQNKVILEAYEFPKKIIYLREVYGYLKIHAEGVQTKAQSQIKSYQTKMIQILNHSDTHLEFSKSGVQYMLPIQKDLDFKLYGLIDDLKDEYEILFFGEYGTLDRNARMNLHFSSAKDYFTLSFSASRRIISNLLWELR